MKNGGPVTRAKIGFQKVPGRRDEDRQIRRFRRIYVKTGALIRIIPIDYPCQKIKGIKEIQTEEVS